MHRFKLENYLKEVFLDSDTSLALVSAAPADDPANTILTNEQMAHTRGARERHRRHAPALLPRRDPSRAARAGSTSSTATAEQLEPDSWKGYTVGDPLVTVEVAVAARRRDASSIPATSAWSKSGIRTVCVHKGLVPPDYEKTFPQLALRAGRRRRQGRARLAAAHVRDLPRRR